jgi:hypothetical protein
MLIIARNERGRNRDTWMASNKLSSYYITQEMIAQRVGEKLDEFQPDRYDQEVIENKLFIIGVAICSED